MLAYGPQLPEIFLEAPEDPNPEKEYVYQAVYNHCRTAHSWVEAGSDDSPEEALDRLRFALDKFGLVPLATPVDVQDIHELLLENQPDQVQPGDYVIHPNGDLYEVERAHRLFADTGDYLDTWRFIYDRCKAEGFWPNVWRLDDHGGLEVYTADEYPSKEEIGRAA